MIELKNISFAYPNKIIFDSFHLNIKQGEKVLLNSPSGSGKTTLLKILMGFLQLNSGEYLFNHQPVTEKNIHLIRNNIAYLSQKPPQIQTNLRELLLQINHYHKNKEIDLYSEFISHLDYFLLDQTILEQKTKELSGGEWQRVALIICLCLKRPFWILDEPTAALDLELKQKTLQKILKQNKTLLIVSHDQIWQNQTGLKTIQSLNKI